jgi:V8-like Glu-specific endopeptidase
MSHNTGTVQTLTPFIEIGPDSGQPATMGNTWEHNFVHTPAPGGTKFVLLHFGAASIPAGNRVEVDLGYGTDIFDSSSGINFWTRPINHNAFPSGIPIRYIADGSPNGSVELQKYGRGESLPGDPGHPSLSNSDPFLIGGSYTEPTYDPFWFCNTPPSWANVQCSPPADIRRQIAHSCGMIITVHGNEVSTCSVTLIGPDTVITAGHCLENITTEWPTSSVTFDYETNCAGGAPGSYNPVFHKVTGYLKFRWNDGSGMDYAILQIAIPPGGLGIPVIPLRNSLPFVGEQIFGVHHPNGAVKKLAPPHTSSEFVNSISTSSVGVDIDVSGGSSGSGLFDMMGRYIGVPSFGSGCNLHYFPSASVLNDIATTPTPAPDQDVMLVIDRSGSMSSSAGTGQTKMEEAKDAASLFVQLIQSNVGHRAGLVSFSTTASLGEGIGNINPGKKNQLIGPSPYSGGAVGALVPGGLTSIGSGIDAAQAELAGGSNAKTILLLTDGLQNTPAMIADAVSDIGTTKVHAIGLGTESSLNGAILSALTQSTGGAYTRAGDGLNLKKFFALAFGDIFEAGTLTDPIATLSREQNETEPVEFEVCDETRITVVVGWDRTDGQLEPVLTSPDGTVISAGTTNTEASFGRTWSFLKVPLPHAGSRAGTWRVYFRRAQSGGEFPSFSPVPLRYFMNVIAAGGPFMTPVSTTNHLYTGDAVTLLVRLAYPDGQGVHGASVKLSVTTPNQAAGTILAKEGLRAPTEIDGDSVSPKHTTLIALEEEQGEPLFTYSEEWFEMRQDRELTGVFEEVGPWGFRFVSLRIPGNYNFRAVGRYGDECKGMREATWTTYVEVGIDEDATSVTTTPVGKDPSGRDRIRVTITPQDQFGNLIGPGSAEGFTVTGIPGSEITGVVTDNRDGSYSVDVLHDPGSRHAPGVSVTQPGRPTACIEVRPDGRAPLPGRWVISWLWLIIFILFVIIVILLILLLT